MTAKNPLAPGRAWAAGSLGVGSGGFRATALTPRPPLPSEGEGEARTFAQGRGGRGADGDGGPLRRDGEGHGVTGVCGRGRWLLQA
jgi:hypothetical protein